MKNKKIDRIKVMFGKYRSLEAEGLPESSLIYLLLTFLTIMAASYIHGFIVKINRVNNLFLHSML